MTQEDKKINKINKIVCKFIKEEFEKTSWPYIDFIEEGRLFYEIKRDRNIDLVYQSVGEISDYIIEQISANCRRSNLLGF